LRKLQLREAVNDMKAAYKYAKKKIAKIEGKVLVCLVLLVLVGGCATCKGIFQDVEWSAGKLAENIETEKYKAPSGAGIIGEI